MSLVAHPLPLEPVPVRICQSSVAGSLVGSELAPVNIPVFEPVDAEAVSFVVLVFAFVGVSVLKSLLSGLFPEAVYPVPLENISVIKLINSVACSLAVDVFALVDVTVAELTTTNHEFDLFLLSTSEI